MRFINTIGIATLCVGGLLATAQASSIGFDDQSLLLDSETVYEGSGFTVPDGSTSNDAWLSGQMLVDLDASEGFDVTGHFTLESGSFDQSHTAQWDVAIDGDDQVMLENDFDLAGSQTAINGGSNLLVQSTFGTAPSLTYANMLDTDSRSVGTGESVAVVPLPAPVFMAAIGLLAVPILRRRLANVS